MSSAASKSGVSAGVVAPQVSIYDYSPKLLAITAERNLLSNLPLSESISPCFLSAEHGKGFVLECGKEIVQLPRDCGDLRPQGIIGGIAFTAQGEDLLRKCLLDYSDKFNSSLPILVLHAVDANNIFLFSRWLQDVLWQSTRILATRNVSFQRELSLLRNQYETLQANFVDLEKYVYSLGNTPILSYNTQETSYTLSVPDDISPGQWIIQELPVPSRGFASVSVHIPTTADIGEGVLLAEVYAHESEQVLDRWSVPYTELQQGWNTFARTRATEDICSENLQFRICWQPDTMRPFKISLSNTHPVPESWVVIYGSTRRIHRPLALRLCSFLPGQQLPAMPATFFPGDASVMAETLKVPGWMLQAVEDLSIGPRAHDFPLVSYIENEGNLQIHPIEESITIGRLSSLCPPGTYSVSATVATVSPQGPIIDYAIAVLPPFISLEQWLHRNNREATQGFSGWLRQEPEFKSQLHVEFETPLSQQCHVYLITKLPEGSVSHFAWARFSNITISTRPLSHSLHHGAMDNGGK